MAEAARKRKWQQSHQLTISKRLHNDKRIDFTQSLLSNELVLHIFSFLSASDLARCSKVSSGWGRLSNDEMLWKPLFLRRFRYPLLLDMKNHPNLLKQWHEWSSAPSSARLKSGWKKLYKTNHNWRIGNCRMTCVEVGGQHERPSTIENSSCVQFARDKLYVAYTAVPLIEVWQIRSDGPPLLLSRLETASGMQQITCLKLDTLGPLDRLVVGYERGGLSVWECADDDHGFSAAEVAVYTPKVQRAGRIVSIGVCYPMILTCTSDMRLSAFCVDTLSTDQAVKARLLYELQSHIRWNPISVELDRHGERSDRWRAMICFGIPVGLNASSVGVQEVILSSETFISSRHCAALGQEDMFFRPHSPGRTRPDSLQPITGISYSDPYLVTSHPNNTIKQYHVRFSKHKMELCFVQTLYGHTSKVSALSLDASIGRLVSGDRFGLKVWDISCSGKANVRHDKPEHHSESHVHYYDGRHIAGTEYIVSISGATQRANSFRDIEWLQFDSDKIVAVVRDENPKASTREKVSVRVWSFAEGG